MVLCFYSGREIECNTKREDRMDHIKMWRRQALPALPASAPTDGGSTEQQRDRTECVLKYVHLKTSNTDSWIYTLSRSTMIPNTSLRSESRLKAIQLSNLMDSHVKINTTFIFFFEVRKCLIRIQNNAYVYITQHCFTCKTYQ